MGRTDLLNQIAGKVMWVRRSDTSAKSERYMQNTERLQRATNHRVADVMTARPVTVTSSATMQEAAARMASRKLNRLIVVDNGTLVGVISSSDVVRLALCDVDEEYHNDAVPLP